MNSLTRFDRDGLELVIDTQTGEAYATQSGYARMSGLSKTALANRLARGYKGVHRSSLKTAELQTDGGLQGVHLLPADLVFEWLLDDNRELAMEMGRVGATVYLHKLAGYKVTSDAIAPTPEPQKPALPPADVRVANLQSALTFFDIDIENPRFKQGIQDLVGDILGLTPNTSIEPSERWLGVVERAEELGHRIAGDLSVRTRLGTHCAKYHLRKKQERRLCCGTQKLINVYLDCVELDRAIESFFN